MRPQTKHFSALDLDPDLLARLKQLPLTDLETFRNVRRDLERLQRTRLLRGSEA